MIKQIIVSLRPHQWYKNLLLFVGLIFSLNLFNLNFWFISILGFIVFSLLSSASYLLNDVLDFKKDQKHPKKKKRPIASGRLSKKVAVFFSLILIIISFLIASTITPSFLLLSLLFFLILSLYSLFLKNIIILDIIVIGIGFVIRVIAGGLSINVSISPWLILCVFLLAFFLVLGKRRNELIILNNKSSSHRITLKHYDKHMIEQMLSIITATLIICYSIYTFLSANPYMMITIPIVIYAIFRYLFLIYKHDFGGEPELLFKDKGMIISILLWLIVSVIIFYFNKIFII